MKHLQVLTLMALALLFAFPALAQHSKQRRDHSIKAIAAVKLRYPPGCDTTIFAYTERLAGDNMSNRWTASPSGKGWRVVLLTIPKDRQPVGAGATEYVWKVDRTFKKVTPANGEARRIEDKMRSNHE